MHGTSVQQCLSSVPRFQAVSRQVSEAFRSRGRRVVVVVREVVEVTLLVVALLPRGGVLSVGVLDLLAIDLVVTEPALLIVHRW